MIDKSLIGKTLPTVSNEVTEAGVQTFANAIGETDPIHLDAAAARAAGYRGVVAPPTYIFVLKYAVAPSVQALGELGIDAHAGELLHAEQSFEHFGPVCAGDTLRFSERVADVYEKKGGALKFMVLEIVTHNQFDELVCKIRHVEVRTGAAG